MVPPVSAPPTPTSPFPSPNTQQPSSLSRLTLSDKLLLSQAVHHIGTSPPDWGRVSSILLSHPLIRTKARLEQAHKAGITLGRVFGSRECERAWVALMRQYNLVLQPGEKEVVNESEGENSSSSTLANRAKEARGLPPKTDRGSQLALAQFLYAERIREIQDSIKIKEQRFKSLVADIEALNSGALNAKLSVEIKALNAQPVTPAVETSSRPPPKDRTGGAGPTATTPGGSAPRNIRLSHSGSAALPIDDQEMLEEEESRDLEFEKQVEGADDVRDATMNNDTEMKELGQERVSELPDTSSASVLMESEANGTREGDDDLLEEEAAPMEAAATPEKDTVKEDPHEVEDADVAGEKVALKGAGRVSVEADEEAEIEPAQKQTRSSKRRNASDAGLIATAEQRKSRKQDGEADVIETEEDIDTVEKEETEANAEEDNQENVEVEEESNRKRAQPRRSTRAGKGADMEDDSEPATPITPITSTSAVKANTKGRLGSLRSREASGASVEEEVDAIEMDNSRSTIDRGSRTSLSPVSGRRGRGTSRRLSSNVGPSSRRSRGGSATSRTETDLSEVDKEKAKRKNEKVLNMILQEVSNHTHGNLFHSAIKEQDAPDYYALIRHPLDIKTIKLKIKEGQIVNSTQLRRALNQMFANSLIYNRPGTEIHRMALEMRDAAEEMIDRFEQTQLSASYARR
ncbi:hypothetical protein CBS101457_006226 [Exobasidium rhododendri]|nr:hypothetical protein CBS101457_006226 [Exobasidium rhododendri]